MQKPVADFTLTLQAGAVLLGALSSGTALAHGEDLISVLFWWAFAAIEGLTLVVVILTSRRRPGKLRAPGVVVIASSGLATFAVLNPESGWVWPCLFLPSLLAFSLGLALRSNAGLASRLVGDLCVGVSGAYGVLLGVYLVVAIRGTIGLLVHAELTSFPWQSAWIFALFPALSLLPYVLGVTVLFLGTRHLVRRERKSTVS